MSTVINTVAEFECAVATGDYIERWSPLSGVPLVAVDLASGHLSPDSIRKLRLLACPLIGVGHGDADLAAACDLLADDTAELEQLAAAITTSPIAALTLMQLLRATENLPLEAALNMESLAYATLQSGPEFIRWLELPRTPVEVVAATEPPVLISRAGTELEITINRPAQRNAIDVAVRDGLIEALRLAVADSEVTRITLSGAGKCFSIGGALEEFGSVASAAQAHAIRSVQLPARWLSLCADRTTAYLHSACIGAGIELPAFAARVVAKKNTFIQLPELAMGLIPGAGGCVSIPHRIGRQRTAWLVVSGRRIDATTALQWGLVDELVE